MLHPKHKPEFDRIINKFRRAGYAVSFELLNARDFNVPQDRKRVIIVGYKKNPLNKKFIFPDPCDSIPTLRDAIGHLKNVSVDSDLIANHEVCNLGFSPFYMSRNRVRDWGQPSFTIPASDRHIPLHPDSPKMEKIGKDSMRFSSSRKKNALRRLSIRECACIQTFPKGYKLIYSRPHYGYKMIGNAVPVNLAYSIAKKIKKNLLEI
jgi:DNA (cytosine-5)-methyltransferase 1